MDDQQFVIAKTFMTRIVMEKIPEAKRWSVSKEFKSWIESVSKEHFQMYMDRLKLLTRPFSHEGNADQEPSKKTGAFILFGSYPPSEHKQREEIRRIGGEATAYYALALWRSLQAEELQEKLGINRSSPGGS